MSRIFVVRQSGYSHLFYCGWRETLRLFVACVWWGVGWVAFACLCVWWLGGYQGIVERIGFVLASFAVGAVIRLLQEMADRELSVEESRIFIGGLRLLTGKFERDDIRQFIMRRVAPSRLCLTIEWSRPRRRPYKICGVVESSEEKIRHLSKFYTVVEDPS